MILYKRKAWATPICLTAQHEAIALVPLFRWVTFTAIFCLDWKIVGTEIVGITHFQAITSGDLTNWAVILKQMIAFFTDHSLYEPTQVCVMQIDYKNKLLGCCWPLKGKASESNKFYNFRKIIIN